MDQTAADDSFVSDVPASSCRPGDGATAAAPERVVGVDALRGLCALAVMIYHFSHWWPFELPPLLHAALEKAGIYGVEVFFVISGFSLYVASTRRDFSRWQDAHAFLVRRAFRILPLLFAATAATVVLRVLGGYEVSAWNVLNNALVLPLVINPALALATGAWSLGVEWGFYLMFPALMLFRGRLLWLLGASLIVLMLYAQLIQPDNLPRQNTLYVSIPNHLAFFLAGMVLGRWRPPQFGTVAVMSVFAVLLAGFVFTLPSVGDQAELVSGWRRPIFLILSVAMVAVFAAWRGGGARGLIWLGDVSFGLYLLHPLVFAVCKFVLGTGWITLLTAVCLTVVVSTLSYYLFERPITLWGKRWSGIRRA